MRTTRPAAWFAILFFLVAMVALLSACGQKPADEGSAGPAMQGDAVQFHADSPQLKVFASQAALAETARTIAVSGRLVWDEGATTRVVAPVAGRITSVEARAGDAVRAGQVLARLASPEFGQAQSDARAAEAAATVAAKNASRSRELGEAGVASGKEVEAAQAELARAQAERDRAVSRLRGYGGGERVDQVFALTSPVAGVVVERNANVGQEFRPDQAGAGAPPLFVVSDPTRLWAHIEIPEGAIALVKRGMALTLTSEAVEGEPIAARVDYVPDGLDALTRTLRVRAFVPNPRRQLKAEMFVRGTLALPGSGVPVVPASAVLLIDGRHILFVDAGGGRFARRAVKAEDAGVERMRILEGVMPGERVVTEGALYLQQVFAAVKAA